MAKNDQPLIDGFRASKERFVNIDKDNFDDPLREVFKPRDNLALEWRIRVKDGVLCIIQYFKDGKGYTVYESEQKKHANTKR